MPSARFDGLRPMRTARRLPGAVVALGLVSLLTDLSSEMMYPLLPAFLTTVLGAGAIALGVIEGVAESTASLLKVASGWWSDRAGRRKPAVVVGYGLSGTARPLIGLTTVWIGVAALRFVDRVGKGIRTAPRDALIADVVEPARRGAAFGLHRAMDHAGAVAGPLVAAGLLLAPGVGLREVFLLTAIPAVAVMVVLVFGVREPDGPVSAGPRAGWPGTGRWGGEGAPLRRLVAGVALFSLGNSSDAFLLLRLGDRGLAPGRVALLWAGLHVVKMVATWWGGRLSDRWGRRRLVLAGWVLYAAVYLGFGFATSTAAFIALFLVYGLYYGLTEPVERAWVAGLAPTGSRGSAFGWYHGATGLTALPASLAFGAVYATAGPGVAFTLGAVLAGAAAVFVWGVPEHLPDEGAVA